MSRQTALFTGMFMSGATRLRRSTPTAAPLQVQHLAAATVAKPEVYVATLVTVKNCRLLRISSQDLLRFGSAVKEAIQLAAWNRRETLLNLSQQLSKVNDNLQVALSSSRSMPGVITDELPME